MEDHAEAESTSSSGMDTAPTPDLGASKERSVVNATDASPPVEPAASSSSDPPVANAAAQPLQQRLQYNMQYVEYVWKREVALLKYYGFVKYMQNQYQDLVHSRLFTTVDASVADPTATTQYSAAKVPFVMTVKMRTELMETWGYSEEEIRQMTPQQAHALLEKERRRSSRSSSIDPQPHQTVDEFHAATVKDAQSVSQFLQASKPTTPYSASSTASLDSSNDDNDASEGTTTWYEIVEHVASPADGDAAPEPQVVALYLNEKDAQFGLTIYEELAQRNQAITPPLPLPTYQIRTTLK
jgi:hypothetical protein